MRMSAQRQDGTDVDSPMHRPRQGLEPFYSHGFACPLHGNKSASPRHPSNRLERFPNHPNVTSGCHVCSFQSPNDYIVAFTLWFSTKYLTLAPKVSTASADRLLIKMVMPERGYICLATSNARHPHSRMLNL